MCYFIHLLCQPSRVDFKGVYIFVPPNVIYFRGGIIQNAFLLENFIYFLLIVGIFQQNSPTPEGN